MPSHRHGPLKFDTVVIGSGITGLTAALVLAQRGQRVAIVEKNRFAAPLLRRFKRGGVWCDPGFHYSGGFEPGGALSVIFRYLRMGESIRPVPMNADGFDVLRMGEMEVSIPVGVGRVEEALLAAFPRSERAVRGYIEKVNAIMSLTPFLSFDLDYRDFSNNQHMIDESLDSFLDGLGAEKTLKELLGQYGQFLYGVPGNEVPFYIHALIMGSFYRSPQTLANGGDELVDAFLQRLAQEGVTLLYGSPAVGIEVDNNRTIKGVKLGNGEMLECGNCIGTMHPGLLADMLPGGAVRPAFLSRLRGLENTEAAFAMYLEVDDVPARLTDANFYRLRHPDALTHNSILAIMMAGSMGRGIRKKGLCVLKESPNSPVSKELYGTSRRAGEYLEYKEMETADTIERLLECYPEMRGKIRVADSATRYTYERYTGTPGGSMYGVKHSVNQIKLSSMTSIRGLYLAGQSILMPGVMGGAVSGVVTAANIIGLETVWNEVKQWRQ